MGDMDVSMRKMVLEYLFDDLAILFVATTRAVIMDGLDFVRERRATARLYKVLPIRIIRVETLGHKMGFDLRAIHENPSHFGRTGIDNQSHTL